MEINQSPLEQLKAFLNKLFQFESQDLDFGVYKILHYKHNEIKQFINELLVDTVKNSLKTLTDAQISEARAKLDELKRDDLIKGWLAASDAEKVTLEKYGKEKIGQFQAVKNQVDSVQVSVDTENQIYNHLTIFFSRYYDTGDFVSKRRFGKNEKYMVPYNGEETHFYWANHDQYYIKSSKTFQKFSFRSGPHKSDLTVHFKLTEAQTELGNVKADAGKYFILSEKDPELNPEEINIFFEYRPLTEEEKKSISKKNIQEKLNEQAAKNLESRLKKHAPAAGLWKIENEQTLLFRKLQNYTKKNQYDFFIHKNLKGFLERELDFYIKSELVSVDDLYVSETDFHLERVRHNFKTIKVFKKIADTIITFLSQIEAFQKKLWEKKKFVLSTQWVITIDRLVEYVGVKAATPILAEVIQNKNQIAEWQALFGKKLIPAGKLTVNSLKSDLFGWMHLPIDTVHFTKAFKENLLNVLSEKIDLENETDGLVIHSDNFHGLKLLTEKHNRNIQTIYIDPPYNTDASAILYKNNYKDSCFASLMDERIKVGRCLLKDDGILSVAIDDEEFLPVKSILKQNFQKQIGIAAVRSNPAGRKTKGKFAPAHEYTLFFAKNTNTVPFPLEISEKRLKRYPQKDKKGNFAWANFIRSGNNDRRIDRPKLYYPIFVSKNDIIRIPDMAWDDDNDEYLVKENPREDETVVFPLVTSDDQVIEKNWQRGHKRIPNELDEFRIRRDKDGKISIDFKTRMDENSLPITWWDAKQYASANYGAAELKAIFRENPFDFPKAKNLVKDCLRVSGAIKPNSSVLDFFPGSGTTFHAVQLLNQEDDGKRKCILIEQGDYVYSIIIPRIKKIAYTFDWKNGKPKDDKLNGLGVFFKYQRLEQYEEALENISYTVSKGAVQKALAFKEYIPKYFLEFETRNSQCLVNTEAMSDPWNYELKIWNGLTYDTRQAVDLVETFNYLIGLHMQKCITKEINGKKYQMVYGSTNGGKQALIIWRSTESWRIKDYEADRDALTAEISAFPYDLLYINGQAHIEGYEPIEHIFKNKMVS